MSSEIKIKKVVLFSSEDKNFKAENLLNSNTDAVCKWKGEKDGNTKQYIVVQLDKPSEIRQIDIENESSASIQVLAGNENDLEEDYCEILPYASFMSPNESKNSANTNRLKIFTDESGLNKKYIDKKFEFVKIACQQPYNKDIQFGITSIRMYSSRVLSDELIDVPKIKTGVFGLKKELSHSPAAPEKEKDEENKAAMFQKWKNLEANKYDNDGSTKNVENESLKRKKPAASDDETENKDKARNDNSENDSPRKKAEVLGTNNDANKTKQNNKHPPKQQILKGVIFALSGFQNPLRSEIRDKGLKLGAKYRPDWTDDCTHLICAFSNTPKAYQVRKAGGIIVTKDWIYDSEKEGVKTDESDYKLEEESDDDDDDTSKPRKAARNASKKLSKLKDEYDDSYDEEEAENSDDKDFIVDDDEIEYEDDMVIEDEEEDSSSDDDSEDSAKKSKSKKKKENDKKKKKVEKKAEKKSKKTKKKSKSSTESSSDSESDLEKYKRKQEKKLLKEKKTEKKEKDEEETVSPKSPNAKKADKNKKKGIKYENESDEAEKKPEMKKKESIKSNKTEVNSDLEMDEDSKANGNDESWKLPSFFDDKNFFIIGDYDQKRRKELNKCIVAYGGTVKNYMNSNIDYVITDKNWNKDFEESKKENKNLIIVNDDWLDACHRRKKLISYIPFEVAPDV